MNDEPPERSDLIRLAAVVEALLGIAERVDGEFVNDALLADLYALRDRAYTALQA